MKVSVKNNKKQLGIAIMISLLLLAGSYLYVQAAPVAQSEAATVSLPAAIVIGIMYYLSVSPWLASLGYSVFYRPLIAGALVGLVMGKPAEGVAIGANINVLYLGWISAGGSLPGDPSLAGYLGTALALGSGLDVDATLALAAPLGLLGSITWSLRMSVSSIFAHQADACAEKADIKGVARANYFLPQVFLFVIYAIPVILAAYLGSAAVSAALNWIAAHAIWVMSGLYTASGMLAALGIALNMKFLFTKNVWPYFLAGYIIATLMGGDVNLLMFAALGGVLAFMHVMFTSKSDAKAAPAASNKTEKKKGLLTQKDVFASWWRWLFFSHSCYNWERMQGTAFAHSMTPIIEKLYTKKEDITAALKRHLVFFNTEPNVGGVIHGIVIAMEEERAMGADISDDAINAVKVGLMGPLAGVGDTISQGILIPVLLAIAMNISTGGQVGTATKGNFLGPIFYIICMALIFWAGGWWVWKTGYEKGRDAVTNILRSGTLDRLMTGAMVLGNFVIGALTVSFVSLSTPLAFTIGGSSFVVQDFLNMFMPNLLPLVLVLVIWNMVARKNANVNKIMLWIIVIGIAASYPIWPSINEAGEIIKAGLLSS
jgi:PTS system mannose-specific IID component